MRKKKKNEMWIIAYTLLLFGEISEGSFLPIDIKSYIFKF